MCKVDHATEAHSKMSLAWGLRQDPRCHHNSCAVHQLKEWMREGAFC